MKKETGGIQKILDSMTSKEVFKLLTKELWTRFTVSVKTKIKDILDEIIHKPFGRMYLMYHLSKNKIQSFMYKKGWMQEPKDTLEAEFDRKTKICFKVYTNQLHKIATERESGNTCFWAIQNGKPIFTAVGAYAYKDWLTKHEFELSAFPYANGFVGGSSVNQSWLASMKNDFDKEVTTLFLKSMDIDVNYTVKNNKTFYSRCLLDLSDFFKTSMFSNTELDFFINRFLVALMRLVYLEQRKLDVNSEHINKLKLHWEQELVHEFTLGVYIIGLTKYAFVFKCLPLNLQKRVPNFHARRSYDKQDKYKAPSFLYANRKH